MIHLDVILTLSRSFLRFCLRNASRLLFRNCEIPLTSFSNRHAGPTFVHKADYSQLQPVYGPFAGLVSFYTGSTCC